jgi:hypothetical protein
MPTIQHSTQRVIFKHLTPDGLHAEFLKKSSGFLGFFETGELELRDERSCILLCEKCMKDDEPDNALDAMKGFLAIRGFKERVKILPSISIETELAESDPAHKL